MPYVLKESDGVVDLIQSDCENCLYDATLRHLVPVFRHRDLGIVNASPLCMGLLTNAGPPASHPAPDKRKLAARSAAAFCEERNTDLSKVALQYALSDRNMDSTIVDIESVETLRSCLNAASETTDKDLLDGVLKIFEPVRISVL
uniref:NADP-dependent oxidoreductase domain-containing protein n=1 Tax=Rhodosorus marinus TaxID=101924 RepID=A0A7S2ZCW3_9RHOD|mmetsp:Transcript_15023/g.61265  ORF Transcript_15023/g.61265 Transcript_15023/m.61265 type:complete len:145 (+) Transcript_15023:2755-3189(+)